jgi:hypothetical protein
MEINSISQNNNEINSNKENSQDLNKIVSKIILNIIFYNISVFQKL